MNNLWKILIRTNEVSQSIFADDQTAHTVAKSRLYSSFIQGVLLLR